MKVILLTNHAFGIDLGTTFSSICLYHKLENQLNYHIDIIKDNKSPYIPSIAYYQEKDGLIQPAVVGNFATDYQEDEPQLVIYDSKRMLGQNYDNPNIKKMKSKWQFQIRRSTNNHILIFFENFQNKIYNPFKVSGDILKHLVEIGNRRFPKEQRTNKVVITIPANFGDYQRTETLKAAKYAGLNVLQLINEPTAAAIAYGLLQDESFKSCLALIFDFGGGTLDVSLLSIQDKKLTVIGTNGDMFLGGRDFDERTCEYLYKKMGIEDESLRFQLIEASIKAKIDLSNDEINESIIRIDSKRKYKLTIDEFEKINRDLIDRILIPVENLLTQTEKNKEQVDKIILVGGSSHMRFVKRKLTEFFGKEPYNAIDPLDAVVTGASIVAAKIVNDENIPEMLSDFKYIDICPFSLGIMIYDGSLDILIKKGTQIPLQYGKVEKSYHTIFYRQQSFTVNIYEIEKNRFLGSFELENLPVSENFVRFIISFSLNKNCILSASARIEDSEISAETIIDVTKSSRNIPKELKLSDEEILSKNIIDFIKINFDVFKKVYKKIDIDEMIDNAKKLKDQHLSDSDLRRIADEWRNIYFFEYFKEIKKSKKEETVPDFLFI